MKEKDILLLNPGDLIRHARYGLCKVDEVTMSFGSFFGITLSLLDQKGKDLMAKDGGGVLFSDDVLFLEGDIRKIKISK